MDLVAQLKKAVKHPFSFVNFFVIFVNAFIFLTIALVLLFCLSFLFNRTFVRTSCNKPLSKSFSGSVSSTSEVSYEANFNGNNKCFLNFWITWEEKENSPVDLWVYNPEGNVSVVHASKDQTNNYFYSPSPLLKGIYRFVLKTTSTKNVEYSAEVSFH